MFANKIPEGQANWANFIRLLTIVDYIFAPTCSEDITAYLRELIHDHHKIFCELYSDCSVTPKLHYMIHIPQWILRYVIIVICKQ